MTPAKALKLLRSGSEGIEEWNRRRKNGEEIPSLAQADLIGADLVGADLRGVNLSGAHLGRYLQPEDILFRTRPSQTNLGDVDLSEAKGLETIEHYGPSTVGVDTLFKSKGKIPEASESDSGGKALRDPYDAGLGLMK
jgi:hypothetical protein